MGCRCLLLRSLCLRPLSLRRLVQAIQAAAAQALVIPLLVIQRPQLSYPLITSTFEEVLQHAQTWQDPA